jgi:hypothetical protein
LYNFQDLKKISDFLCEPFPYSRLTKISKSTALAARLEEETKLHKLNLDTKKKFSYLLN